MGTEQGDDLKIDFEYDYLGRRVEKRISVWDVTLPDPDWNPAHANARHYKFVWDGWLMLMELEGGAGVPPAVDSVLRKYTWGLDLAGQSGAVNSLGAAGGIGGLLAVAHAETGGGISSDR